MSRLDWKNVANPDFTAAAALQQSASRDIANALTGIGTFVDGVANRNNAQNQKALELAKIRYLDNPTGLRKAVIGGEFDDLLSARGITGQDVAGMRTVADDYLTSLQGHRSDERAEDLRTRRLAARPDMVNAILAQQRGDYPASDRIVQESNAIRNLDFSDVDGFIGDVTAGGQTYRTESNSRKSFAEDRMVEQFLASLDYNNMSAESKLLDLDAAYNNGNSRMPAGVYNRIRSTLLGGAPAAAGGGMGGVAAPTGSAQVSGGFLSSDADVSLGSGNYDFIPYKETREYIPKVLNFAGPMPEGMNNRQKAEWLREAVIKTESAGNPNAVSKKGARGLMQIMPETAKDPGLGVKPLQNDSPEENVRFGVDYLEALLKRYNGNTEAALAAYNGGMKNADRWFAGRTNTPANAIAQAQLVGDDAAAASAAAAGGNRNYLALMEDKRSANEIIDAELGEGGRFSGYSRSAVNDALRRIKELSPKLEGVNSTDKLNADWRMSDAMALDILASSMSLDASKGGTVNTFLNGVLPYASPAAYIASRVLPERFAVNKGGSPKTPDASTPISLNMSEAQRLINDRYRSTSGAGAQAARNIDQNTDARNRLVAEVAQLEQSVRALDRAANTPGKQREVARAEAVLREKQAELEAANASGPVSPRKGDAVAAARVDQERKDAEMDALIQSASRLLPVQQRLGSGPQSFRIDEDLSKFRTW